MSDTRKREQEEAARQAWLAQRKLIDDPALRQRVIDTVDEAIATATPEQTQDETLGGVRHVSVWWSWKSEGDTSAQKSIYRDGCDYAVVVEGDDPDDGPWVLATSRSDGGVAVVRWMPGLGFDTAETFLDRFTEASRAA
jgi:hypothetical protein